MGPRVRSLITGAGGFVGSHLARRLCAGGGQVRCLVRPGGDLSALEGLAVERVLGDVTDPGSLARAVYGVEVVFHLAGVRRAATPKAFMDVNAEGTRRVCEAMVASGTARRLVLCGSLAAAGPSTPDRPRLESDPLAPDEWYGQSKAEGEKVAMSYADRLEVTSARPARILGPGDRENLVFFKLLKKGVALHLGGGPRPLSLVDVQDVVDLLVLLADRPEAVGEAFFVAGPGTMTLEQLQAIGAQALGVRPRPLALAPAVLRGLAQAADLVTRVSGRRLPLNRKLARQLLAPAWTCSTEKAARVLGFIPKRSVEESVRQSALWYREQGWI
jgi:dihydroflavonol-4-reductase